MSKITTYCSNNACPFKDCDKHLTHLPKAKEMWVYLADLDAVCRRYISYIVDCVGGALQ